jgi:hypothetical protein
MQQFGRDRVESGHRADVVDRSKLTHCDMRRSEFSQRKLSTAHYFARRHLLF